MCPCYTCIHSCMLVQPMSSYDKITLAIPITKYNKLLKLLNNVALVNIIYWSSDYTNWLIGI